MTETITSDPLALKQCPHCDYALTGLPADGLCPECGQAYDGRFIVLFGDARGAHAGLHNTSGKGAVVGLVIMGVSLLVLYYTYLGRNIIGLIILTAAMVLPLMARLLSVREARLLVIANSQGVAQRDTVDQNSAMGLAMRWSGFGLLIAWCAFIGLRTPNAAWPGILPLVIIWPLMFYSIRRRRRQQSVEVPGPLGEPIRLYRWDAIDSSEIRRVSEGRYRVRFTAPLHRFAAVTSVVDAEVSLDDEAATALCARLTQWRSGSAS